MLFSKRYKVMTKFHEISHQSLAEFKQSIESLTSEELAREAKNEVLSPFHYLVTLTPQQEAREKIIFLFAHAKRLKLDPNFRIDLTKIADNTPDHLRWDNTPVHSCIAMEHYALIPVFLEAAKKNDFEIDLDIPDKLGKTAFMFALQMGVVQFSILKQLITRTNYNKVDQYGRSPMMMACAMRRLDVAECLLQFEVERLKLGAVDLYSLTKEQKEKLSPFVNQTHVKSGKSLAHFALLRHGSFTDQTREDDYQETVLNILKAVCVDGNRDVKATWNALTNETNNVINTADSYVIRPVICYVNHVSQPETAMLSCKANFKYFTNHQQILPLLFTPVTISYVQDMFKAFEGVSLAEAILKRTPEMINFLQQIGVDFSHKQKNEKTPLMYVEALHRAAKDKFVTKADEDHLIPLRSRLKGMVKKSQPILPEFPEIKTVGSPVPAPVPGSVCRI